MKPDLFSTHLVPSHDQLSAWRAWFDPVFDVAPHPTDEAGFRAESTIWTLNGFGISRVSAPGLQAVRTKPLIKRNPVDHWVITIGQRAATNISTRGASVQAPARTPFILSLGDELVSERGEDERLQVYLTRDDFGEIAPLLDAARGMILSTSLGKLLGEYLELVERSLPDVEPEEVPKLTGAVRAMVAACVTPSPDRLAEAADLMNLSRMERIRRAVGVHLRSPDLGTTMLCAEVGVSRSLLYRVLDSAGGVARYIQRRRLAEAYVLLSGAANTKSVASIAEELCFADASSFSRAFRQEFGVRPSDVRASSRVTSAPSRNRFDPQTRTLISCLSAF